MSLSSLVLLAGCQQNSSWDGSLENLLLSQPERFATVMQGADKYRLQIIYTQVDRDENNRATFESFTYRLDPDQYYYPASTVKLPAALLALEKLNRLGIPGLGRDTTVLTNAATDAQTPALTDPTSPTGLPTIAHYIRKVLLVSDNDAFNRIYEFLGQKELNESLHDKGYNNTRIFHRLEVGRNFESNRATNPVTFVDGDTVIYEQEARVSDTSYEADEPILMGRAEIVGGKLLERPKDFSVNNEFALQDLHDVMQALIFPADVLPKRKFDLTDDDYRFVYRNMSGYPGESGIDAYADPAVYPDGRVKSLMVGGSTARVPENIRIFNKSGEAYGFKTDCAYIVDYENGVEFLLAATLYTNDNQTFNDDNYEYDEIALPFLRNLGLAIYEVELARERPFRPNLSRVQLDR
ncbi:MAG: hypothetical protein GWP02_03240 [Desulfobulbaceae bacterium]|nr:hypothetical protein [Desulfobulbaceae bacterium]